MAPRSTSSRIPVSLLSPTAFAPFGQVIQNPSTHNGSPKLETATANQGTATKWFDPTLMENFYHLGASGQEAKCVVNLFICRPRQLEDGRLFHVKIMERHPCTPQTFVPMGLGKEDREPCYLVVVAPTLPTSNDTSAAPSWPKGSGKPDIANIRAFIAKGDQGIAYGPGTWHAPMVVLGEKEIEFVVVQYANGVGEEDCQEIGVSEPDGVVVDVGSGEGKAKL